MLGVDLGAGEVVVEGGSDSVGSAPTKNAHALTDIKDAIISCGHCPRLVRWREQAAKQAPRAYAREDYWARPVPGFGDPGARVYALGLATSAHGGNRTGRAFTGNPSADWLVAALHRAGLANQPTSTHRADGLELRGVWMGSAVRCAPPQNRPTATERASCVPYLRAELGALSELRVLLTLGQFAWRCALDLVADRPFAKFAHGAEHRGSDGLLVLASYHPSPQNTNTGRLTAPMFDDVLRRAKALAGLNPTCQQMGSRVSSSVAPG